MSDEIQISLEVWVHGGSDKPTWDWFVITGERIDHTLLKYLISAERQEDVNKFEALPRDQACQAILLMSWQEDDNGGGGWFIDQLLAFHPIPDVYNAGKTEWTTP